MGITVWHNIVYSTKGGCGKTTFCMLFPRINLKRNKAGKQIDEGEDTEQLSVNGVEESQDKLKLDDKLFLYRRKSKSSKDKDNFYPLVIIDLDLAASNLSDDYVYIGIQKNSNKSKIESVALFNYLIKNKSFKYEVNYNLKDAPGAMLIRGPQTEYERAYFKSKRRYVPVVKFDEFKYSMSKLLDEISDESRYDYDRKTETLDTINVVYDLPPNSDGYTEILFDLLLNKNSTLRKNKDNDIEHKIRLFILTNPEKSIKDVNKSFLKSFLHGSGSNYLPDQVFFVENMAVKTEGHIEQNNDAQYSDLAPSDESASLGNMVKPNYQELPLDLREIKSLLKDKELLHCSIGKISNKYSSATLTQIKKI